MPGRSSAPIVLRFSVSIRPWAQAKLIQQNVLTVTSIESKSSNAASLVKLPAANHRQTPLSRSVGDVSGEPVIPQDHCGRSAGERSPDQLPWRLGRPTGGRWSWTAGWQIAIQRRTYPQRVLEAPVPICHESDTAEAEPSVDGVAEEYAVPPGTVDAPPTSVCPLSHPAPQGPIGW